MPSLHIRKIGIRKATLARILIIFAILISSFNLFVVNHGFYQEKNVKTTFENPFSNQTFKNVQNTNHYSKSEVLPSFQSDENITEDLPTSTYLIVTTNDICLNSQILDDFVRYKNTLGYYVKIITEDDFGVETGKTRAINIRNWLKNHYQTEKIRNVLLIGNPDPDNDDEPSDYVGDIPMMMCWPLNNGTGEDYSYEESPTDYFYADLTGDWDSDGDGYYGEFGYGHYDNPEDEGVDFSAELMVGRIPVYSSDYTSLDHILNNSIYHHQISGLEKYRILEPMAISNYDDEDGITDYDRVDGRDLPESLWNSTLRHLNMNDTVLYEKAGLDPVPDSAFHNSLPLTRSNVIDEINSDYGAILWWGHGSETGAYRKYWDDSFEDGDGIPEAGEMIWEPFLQSSDTASLNPNHSSFIFQISCNNGYPENSNNLGYSLLKSGVSISTVSSSRVSWYGTAPWRPDFYEYCSDNAGLGWAYMHNLLYENMTSGQALTVAKELGGEDWGGHSWMNKMDFNLYGDPQLKYWSSEVPNNPILQAPLNESLIYTSSVKLSVKVEDIDSDFLNVTFFNASDDSIIGWDLNVPSGQNATIWWQNLTKNADYGWYVIVSDGQTFKKSRIWSLETAENVAPSIVSVSPKNNIREQFDFVELRVEIFDLDNDNLNVTFYNAEDQTIIGVSTILNGSGNATIIWDNLLWNRNYLWFFTVDDGHYIENSSVYGFFTNYCPEIKSTPIPNNGSVFEITKIRLAVDVLDEDLSPLIVNFYENTSGELLGTVNVSNGNGTAEFLWQGLSYETIYNWYVEIDDGIVIVKSEVFWFQIGPDPTENSSTDTLSHETDDSGNITDTSNENDSSRLKIAGFSSISLLMVFSLSLLIIYLYNSRRR